MIHPEQGRAALDRDRAAGHAGVRETMSVPLAAVPQRRSWQRPQLRVLGSIADLTQHVGRRGRPDGGRGTMRRS